MYYINKYANTNGNYGNPMHYSEDWLLDLSEKIVIPDELISDYIDAKGFVLLTVENGVVTSVKLNKEALDAYEASLPPVEPEEPTEEDDVNSMLVDHEYRLTLLELGV